MTDPKELVRRLRADNSHWQSASLCKEAAAFIEAHDKPALCREEMVRMWREEVSKPAVSHPGWVDCETAALAFGEAIQRHFMGGGREA